MAKKRLIYVSSPYTGAVVEGQVYELLEYYKQQDWFEDVLLLQSYASENDRKKSEEVLSNFSFRKKFFWMNPYYPFFYKKSIKALKKTMNEEITQNTVFHVRSGVFGHYVREALSTELSNLLILVEFRGALSDELKYTSTVKLKERIKARIKIIHINKCYGRMQKDEKMVYTAVSPLLRIIESKEDGFDVNKIFVHPNIAANYFKYNLEQRIAIRKELGVKDNQVLVVTSSGESGMWQKDLDLVDSLTAKGFVVLNLSKKTLNKPNVISRFVPHKEMPSYLSACDAALLWRDDVLLNNVACPSKYCEFAEMGLYVIHNKTVDIATRFIKDNNCGLLVDTPEEIELPLELFSEEARQLRCSIGHKTFSVEEIAKSYRNILQES